MCNTQTFKHQKCRQTKTGLTIWTKLGIHNKCDSSWCSVAAGNHTSKTSSNNIPPNLLFELERTGDRLVSKAAQLIQDQTTNLSECYMSVRAKMDGGKQINRIQSGPFQHCCMAAALRLTLGPTWIAGSWKHFFGSCSSVLITCANRRKRQHQ